MTEGMTEDNSVSRDNAALTNLPCDAPALKLALLAASAVLATEPHRPTALSFRTLPRRLRTVMQGVWAYRPTLRLLHVCRRLYARQFAVLVEVGTDAACIFC